jgi:hypothetical protein
VIARFLEAFFRYKLLIVLPVVVIPLIVGPVALLFGPVYYETWVGIWVERPTYLSYNDDWNRYNTPAQNQAGRLNELLRTRSFVLDVAKRTQLAPLVGTPKGEDKIAEILGKGIWVAPNGNQLVLMRFRADTPQLSFQVINALVETFQEKAATDRANQAVLAISFYESRQKGAEEEFKRTNDALRRYVAANPRLSTIDPGRGAAATAASRLGLPTAAIDPQLAELLRQLQVAETDLNRARNALDQASLDAEASREGQSLGFQVVDAPQMPTAPIRERRRLLIYPIAGLLIGLGISGTLLILLVAGDRTVRTETEFRAPERILVSIPHLDVRHLSKKAGPDIARRAVGSPAGMALPSPQGVR